MIIDYFLNKFSIFLYSLLSATNLNSSIKFKLVAGWNGNLYFASKFFKAKLIFLRQLISIIRTFSLNLYCKSHWHYLGLN